MAVGEHLRKVSEFEKHLIAFNSSDLPDCGGNYGLSNGEKVRSRRAGKGKPYACGCITCESFLQGS